MIGFRMSPCASKLSEWSEASPRSETAGESVPSKAMPSRPAEGAVPSMFMENLWSFFLPFANTPAQSVKREEASVL